MSGKDIEQSWSCPGKVFLCGEYLVLETKQSLLINLEPRFHLKVSKQNRHNEFNACNKNEKVVEVLYNQKDSQYIHSFHPLSPAGKLLIKLSEAESQSKLKSESETQYLKFEFIDPYQGEGGYGASTAQYLLAYSFFKKNLGSRFALKNYWELYQELSWDGEGMQPSGADLISQLHGGILFVSSTQNQTYEQLNWCFKNLGILFFSTGIKIPTHLHLKEIKKLDLEFIQNGKTLLSKMRDSFLKNSDELMVQAFNQWSSLLSQHKLICDEVFRLCRELDSLEGVLGSKGCGALGADVVAILYDRNYESTLFDYFNKRFKWVRGLEMLSKGCSCD